jgi:hypothetical protein
VASEPSKCAAGPRADDAVDRDPRTLLHREHRALGRATGDPVHRARIETLPAQRDLECGDARFA